MLSDSKAGCILLLLSLIYFIFYFIFFTFCNNPFICNIPKVLHLIYFKKRYTTVSAL